MSEGRVPPYSLQAERALLGSVLLNNRSLPKIRQKQVSVEQFYVEAHRRIFKAMIDLDAGGSPIDHVTLGNFLSDKGELEKVGGVIALGELTDQVATIQNVEHYARIVFEDAARRRMIYAAQQIVADGYAKADDTEEYLIKARSTITNAANAIVSNTSGPRMVDEDLVAIYEEIVEKKMPEGLISTGLGTIDNITGGLWPGLMVVVAGRPGMGKSAFILNIANNVSMSGKKVLYFTLEDTRRFVIYRMLSRFANIDLMDLMLRRVDTSDEYTRILDAMSKIGNKKPLWIEDASSLKSEHIAQVAAAHKELHGLDLVIIDHLGEVGDTGENETTITTKAARNFRDIAKDLNIPVILASQLNRSVEQRNNKRPMLSDLRQSGEIEAVARSVWFLYRPGYYMGEEGKGRRDLEVNIAKTNHGRLGMVKHFAKLENMFIRGWEVDNDGLWPGDEDLEITDSKKATEKEYSNGQKAPGRSWHETDNDY